MTAHDPSQPHAAGRDISDVPVFNCHVYLAQRDAQGVIVARVANLPGIVAEGRSEREALRNVVQRFKETVMGHLSRGEPIPWSVPPAERAPGELERFVPVHL